MSTSKGIEFLFISLAVLLLGASLQSQAAKTTVCTSPSIRRTKRMHFGVTCQQRLSDSESPKELTGLFADAESIAVQRAIVGILIRSDYPAISRPDVVRSLRQHRLNSTDGEDMIEILIRYLQAS